MENHMRQWMKRTVLLLLVLCLTAGLPFAGAESEETAPELIDKLPEKYLRAPKEGKGHAEMIRYPSRDYTGDGAEVTKRAVVYLPAGYSEEETYDLLVLCHGIGGSENEWGFLNPYSIARNIVEHLIADGTIRPLIIVMPNGRSTANFNDTSFANMQSFYTFGQELRNDLLPWMDAHYATYGAKTPEDLTASRDHRFMAGLSMGGMQTINIGLCECLDLFSAFGAFSAAPTSYPASRIAQEIQREGDYPVRMFYSICGTEDGTAYGAAAQAAKELPKYTDRITEDNWIWHELPGGHDFNIWHLGLLNFLRVLAD